MYYQRGRERDCFRLLVFNKIVFNKICADVSTSTDKGRDPFMRKTVIGRMERIPIFIEKGLWNIG